VTKGKWVVRAATEADAAQLADVHVRSWQWAYHLTWLTIRGWDLW
jgi:hypothetical protein